MSCSDTKPPLNIPNDSPGWRTVKQELLEKESKDLGVDFIIIK